MYAVQQDKCHNERVYSSRMLAGRVLDLTGPSSGVFVYKLCMQTMVCGGTKTRTAITAGHV